MLRSSWVAAQLAVSRVVLSFHRVSSVYTYSIWAWWWEWAYCYNCRAYESAFLVLPSGFRPSAYRQAKSNHTVTFTGTFASVTVHVLNMNRIVGQLRRSEWGMPQTTLLIWGESSLVENCGASYSTEATIFLHFLTYIPLRQERYTSGITVNVSMSVAPPHNLATTLKLFNPLEPSGYYMYHQP
jgi:hypothetical protein